MYSSSPSIIFILFISLQISPLLVNASNEQPEEKVNLCNEIVPSNEDKVTKITDQIAAAKTKLSISPGEIFAVSRKDQEAIAAIKKDLRSLLIHHQLIHSRFFHAMALRVASEERGGFSPPDFQASQILYGDDLQRKKIASEIYAVMRETIYDKSADKTSLDFLQEAPDEALAFFRRISRERMISEFSLALLHWAKIIKERGLYISSSLHRRENFRKEVKYVTSFSTKSLFKNGKNFEELGLDADYVADDLSDSDWNNLLHAPELTIDGHKTFFEDMGSLPDAIWDRRILTAGGTIAVGASYFFLNGFVGDVVHWSSVIGITWSTISSWQYSPPQRRFLKIGELVSDDHIFGKKSVSENASEEILEPSHIEGDFEVVADISTNEIQSKNESLALNTLGDLQEAMDAEEKNELDPSDIQRKHYLTVGNSAARLRQDLNKVYYENYFFWMQTINLQQEKNLQLLEKVKAKSVLSQQEVLGIRNLEDMVYLALTETALAEGMANQMSDFLIRDLNFMKNALETFQDLAESPSGGSLQFAEKSIIETDIIRQSDLLYLSMSQHQKFVNDLPVIYKALSDTASFLRKLQEAGFGSFDLNIEDYQSKINTLMDFMPKLEGLQAPTTTDVGESVPYK